MTSPRSEGAYLDALDQRLRGVPPVERSEILAELRNHFAEARAEGTTDTDIIERLSSPRLLARAYRLELANRSEGDGSTGARTARWLELAGFLTATSLPTLVLVPLLGSMTIGFVVAGLAITAGGIALVAGFDPDWVKWPYPASMAFLAGPAMALAGVAAGYALFKYVSLCVKTLRKLLPGR